MTTSPPQDSPYDEGLQPERTLLAWRRTALALAVAGIVAVRFGMDVFGVAALVICIIAVLLATGAYVAALHRYRRAHRGLTTSGELWTGGTSALLLSLSVLVIGGGCLAYVLVKGLSAI